MLMTAFGTPEHDPVAGPSSTWLSSHSSGNGGGGGGGGGRFAQTLLSALESAKAYLSAAAVVIVGALYWAGSITLVLSLSAAQPTDQGEESVVLLVGVGGGTAFKLPMYSFLGCAKQKLCIKRDVKKQKLCLKRGVKRENFVVGAS